MARLADPTPEIVGAALEQLRRMVRESTSSMTSVPRALKMLRDHYAPLQKTAATLKSAGAAFDAQRRALCDVLAALALTLGSTGEVLRFKLVRGRIFRRDWPGQVLVSSKNSAPPAQPARRAPGVGRH